MELYDYVIMKYEEGRKFFFHSLIASQNTCITSHSKSQRVLISLFTFFYLFSIYTKTCFLKFNVYFTINMNMCLCFSLG